MKIKAIAGLCKKGKTIIKNLKARADMVIA